MARLRSSLVFRCPGYHVHRPPVLGVFNGDGTLHILKDDLDLYIKEGRIVLGCRDCRYHSIFGLPLTSTSMDALERRASGSGEEMVS